MNHAFGRGGKGVDGYFLGFVTSAKMGKMGGEPECKGPRESASIHFLVASARPIGAVMQTLPFGLNASRHTARFLDDLWEKGVLVSL